MTIDDQRAPDRDLPDLVRLSLALMGGMRSAEILDSALDVLGRGPRGTRWAILRSIGSGRFEARCHAGIGEADLVSLCRSATGRDPWLVLDRQVPREGLCGLVDAAVYPDGEHGAPALILGRWRDPADRRPIPAADQLQISMAAELIACASGVARECEQLREQSARDSLTGLLNRRGAIDTLEREVARAVRRGAELSVLYADLDEFKALNDRRGHAAGDEALVLVGELLSHALRGSDAIGRLGGDEFLIILPDTAPDVAERIGARLRRTVSESKIVLDDGLPIRLGLTYGVASIADRLDVAGLIDLADRHMLERKPRCLLADSGRTSVLTPAAIANEAHAAAAAWRRTRPS